MKADEINRAFAVLKLRERLIFKLAVLVGLRPGEIFGLRRTRLSENTADIQERIYRGKVDTPKTTKSIRIVALSASVREDLEAWQNVSPDGAESWLFPSEKLDTPL